MDNQVKFSAQLRSCIIGAQTIRGMLFMPEKQGPLPFVIGSHGFGSAYESLIPYAEVLASHGFACYVFDFRGGSDHGTSDGLTTDMSVMTEVADLHAVLSEARTWPEVDADRVVLLGASQGAFVSAVAAARMREDVHALILLYPAFVLVDDMHKNFGSLENVPAQVFYRDRLLLGRRYFSDVWFYNPYNEIGRFEGPVLIIHGTADEIVPLEYAERALSVYKDARIDVVPGAGHGFSGEALTRSEDDIIKFLSEIGM